MKRALALLVGTFLSTHAYAIDQCTPSPDDPQVRICDYDPMQRYVINGLVDFPVNLKFADDERIKRVEYAYTGVDEKGNPTATWRGPGGPKDKEEVKDRYTNNLPIWPYHAGRSALIVVTQRPGGSERTYLFDLNAREAATNCLTSSAPGCPADVTTTLGIEFKYPEDVAAAAAKAAADKKAAAIAAWRARQAKVKEEEAVARLKVDVFYGNQNYNYQAKADPKFKFLAPSRVSDNGWLTEMTWPANVQIPAITILDPATGQEQIASVSQQGSMEVINGTAQWFRLRLGQAVMDIHNLAWNANRPDPGTGTTSPDVVRQVIYRNASQ